MKRRIFTNKSLKQGIYFYKLLIGINKFSLSAPLSLFTLSSPPRTLGVLVNISKRCKVKNDMYEQKKKCE